MKIGQVVSCRPEADHKLANMLGIVTNKHGRELYSVLFASGKEVILFDSELDDEVDGRTAAMFVATMAMGIEA